MAKPRYTKPASTLDLEARQKSDYVPPAQLNKGVDPDVSDNGFVGVDPIYQNFANDTEEPLQAEGGAESKLEEAVVSDDVDTRKGATDEGVQESEEEGDDADGDTNPTPPTPTSPVAPSTPGTSNS